MLIICICIVIRCEINLCLNCDWESVEIPEDLNQSMLGLDNHSDSIEIPEDLNQSVLGLDFG